ncbi:hypothetical protein HPB51_008631 [Rhipicephalus microplus]|uniref:Apple domain-containing protein n=1 Tax=Rhipicephalus microplus TaxID=6941 RepID=A0A9J6ENX3_RHIMP|nr:hypothetical protein HPB51_008631 [Rhipicephalus microplus]
MSRLPVLMFLLLDVLTTATTGQDVPFTTATPTPTTTLTTAASSTDVPTTTRTLASQTAVTLTTSTTTPTTYQSSSSPFAPEFTTAEASPRAITSESAVPWCLREHVSYERLSGYKVADMLAGQRTLPEPTQPAPPSTAEECYLRCLDDDRCRGYSVNHVRQVCALTWFDVANRSDYLLADPNWSFHRKICLPGEYATKMWLITRLITARLN